MPASNSVVPATETAGIEGTVVGAEREEEINGESEPVSLTAQKAGGAARWVRADIRARARVAGSSLEPSLIRT
jgi:hypothetical protein